MVSNPVISDLIKADRAVRVRLMRCDAILEKADITFKKLLVLIAIYESDKRESTPAKIAELYGMDRSAITRLHKRMSEYLVYSGNADRRQTTISISANGVRALNSGIKLLTLAQERGMIDPNVPLSDEFKKAPKKVVDKSTVETVDDVNPVTA